MSGLEIIKVISEIGALGIAIYVIYLFVSGKILSEPSVKKLMDAQANHIGDLKDVMEKKFNKMIKVLEQIRENGAMNRKK